MAEPHDLFVGLPLDYAFLEDASSALGPPHALATTDENAVPNAMGDPQQHVLFEHDVPLPLGFTAFPSYRPAPQHRHKRVRSNPDVLFGFQLMATTSGGGGGLLDPVAEAPLVIPRADLVPLQSPVAMAPIGPVQVTTPVGLRTATASVSAATTSPIPFQAQAPNGGDESQAFKDMDEFLQDLSWAELPTDDSVAQPMDGVTMSSNSSSVDHALASSPVAYRSQRIHDGVQELQMKRKRPQQTQSLVSQPMHARHHSNPVDLLHNLDQFRLLAQQTKQQHQLQQLQQQDPTSVLNPFGVPPSSGVVLFHQSPPMPLPQPHPQPQPFSQFQVPAQIASGSARSLHSRRSSLPSAAGLASGGNGNSVPPRAATRRAQRSSGLSMDLSQMNLGFLAVPEEEFHHQTPPQPPLPQPQHHFQHEFSQLVQQAGALTSTKKQSQSAVESADEANRKLYKCGRCGQPKVGHICTMPDQRNNWTQVDLDVTKGIKVMRVNCHILPVKARWVTLHDENVDDEQHRRRHVSMFSA